MAVPGRTAAAAAAPAGAARATAAATPATARAEATRAAARSGAEKSRIGGPWAGQGAARQPPCTAWRMGCGQGGAGACWMQQPGLLSSGALVCMSLA